MGHETIWHARAAGEAASTCGSALERWPDVVRGGPTGRGLSEFGVSVVAVLSARGPAGAPTQADARTAAATVRRPKAHAREAPGARLSASGLPDGCLDARSDRRSDPPRVWGSLSSQPRLEGADRARLELPEARTPRGGAGRGRHRPVDAARLAPDKKTPHDVAPISSSSMRAAFC